MAERSIAVVGAAGLVGRELLRQFEEVQIPVTAIVRSLPELSVDGDFHVGKYAKDVDPRSFDVVINLAYPTSGAPFEQPAQNAAIIETVNGLVREGGHLIQVSTMAVFGMTLDRPVAPGPVPEIRDLPYVESKIEAEHAFTREQEARRLSLDIVRLGNVWGYASGAWALPIAQGLLMGQPLGIAGAPGFSNATDVANVASYLVHLVRRDVQSPGARYHHLAEFSSVRWSEWIAPIAEHLGVDPVYAERSWITLPESMRREVSESIVPGGIRSIHQRLAESRVGGSVARAAIRKLPGGVQSRLRSNLVFASPPVIGNIDQIVLIIMAGEREFVSHVDAEWQPRLSQTESLEGVIRWLDRD